MKKKFLAGLAAASTMTLAMAGPAAANLENPRHPHHDPYMHGHMKIIGLEEQDGYVRYRKCVDLPVTPMHAHHVHKHIGGAHGPNQLVIPTFGIPNCAVLAVVIGPPGVWFSDPD
jgi:hypothetical protein